MSKNDILHELIDVVAGRQAHLSVARALEMHDEIDPGYNDAPVTAEEAAAAQAVLDRQAREAAAAAAAEAPGPAAVDPEPAAPAAF